VKEWWPWELPPEYESHAPLVEGNDLSFEAMTYLEKLSEQDNVGIQSSLSKIEGILDNRKFKQLFDTLRNNLPADADGAQADYVTLRKFIIEHPYAQVSDISHVFSETRYINAAQVNELYRTTGEITPLLTYPNAEGLPVFWVCEHCGPLFVRGGQRESVKKSACGKHCPRFRGGWKEVKPSGQIRVLRRAIHLRVHLPGIPELALFNWLEERQEEYPSLIKKISLWPRIDTYDLQIQFADSTWAVDVKDREKPDWLGRVLTELYHEGDLQWDRGFYVYPSYRDSQQRNYGETIRLEVNPNLQSVEVVSDVKFKEQVISKLRSLKKGRP
jgi:hypothetical protein